MLNFAVKPSDSDNESALWNAADVGIYLKKHQSTIWAYLAQQLIPEPVKIGGSVNWRKDDIVLFVECDCSMKEYRKRKREQKK